MSDRDAEFVTGLSRADADTEAGRGEGREALIRDMNGKPPREWTDEQIAAYLTDANAYKKAKYVGSGEVDCEAARRLRQSDPGELSVAQTLWLIDWEERLDVLHRELLEWLHGPRAAAPTDEAPEERDRGHRMSVFRKLETMAQIAEPQGGTDAD